jgi:hypothetical protein
VNEDFDSFVVYYVAWHEGEFNLQTMKKMVLDDIGQEGLTNALIVFRAKRLERESRGDYRTLFQAMQASP